MNVIIPPRRTEFSPSGGASAAAEARGGSGARQPSCIADVVEQLLCEFGSQVSLPTVAQVVLRLNQDNSLSLPALMGRARLELVARLISRG